jgi:hypothetical protein
MLARPVPFGNLSPRNCRNMEYGVLAGPVPVSPQPPPRRLGVPRSPGAPEPGAEAWSGDQGAAPAGEGVADPPGWLRTGGGSLPGRGRAAQGEPTSE